MLRVTLRRPAGGALRRFISVAVIFLATVWALAAVAEGVRTAGPAGAGLGGGEFHAQGGIVIRLTVLVVESGSQPVQRSRPNGACESGCGGPRNVESWASGHVREPENVAGQSGRSVYVVGSRTTDTEQAAGLPYAMHSMVYSSAPYGFEQVMFREAAASGAKDIRLDLELDGVFHNGTTPDWTQVDQVVALARRYKLNVTAIITATPVWIARCPPTTTLWLTHCPPADFQRYGQLVERLARHTRGVIDTFEVLNEPDGSWTYAGTALTYARTLSVSYDAIKRGNPRAKVLLGGVMSINSMPWVEEVLALTRKFDVSNVHVRGSVEASIAQVKGWRVFFARHGIHRPLWVTEHGYPSDSTYQYDPRYRDGEDGQARYLKRSLPGIVRVGAAKVFVTQRDNLGGEFASEGLLGGSVLDPPQANPHVRRKPAFYVFRSLARAASRASQKRSRQATQSGSDPVASLGPEREC